MRLNRLEFALMHNAGRRVRRVSARDAAGPAVPARDPNLRYIRHDHPFTAFPAGAGVLDVGCGPGDQLADLVARGCRAVGVEPDAEAAAYARARGLRVVRGRAEALPVAAASVDGVVCKVVLPYTDERRALAECARVLRPGGRLELCGHGAGYYVRYALFGPTWRLRAYGLRVIGNTWIYRLTGRRLPGWVGDTVYQSPHRLARDGRRAGLAPHGRPETPAFAGLPVFIYRTLTRTGTGDRVDEAAQD